MRIVKFTAENVKRIKAVEINADPTMQIIAGGNDQGKTSVIDAIWMAISGAPALKATTRPIRDGADHAVVTLDLGDKKVTRTWKNGTTTLVVETAEGARFSSPQKVLDSLVGQLSFDPLAFTRLNARDQAAALAKQVDMSIDLEQFAEDRRRIYNDRTETGRTLAMLKGQQQALGFIDPEFPEDEVSIRDLISERIEVQDAQNIRIQFLNERRTIDMQIEDLESRLVHLRARAQDVQASLDVSEDQTDRLADLNRQLENAEVVNVVVRTNRERRQVEKAVNETQAEYDGQTKTIAQMDQMRNDALAQAKFPVEGLGFDDDGVTFNGVPFSQASASGKIQVSLAMAMAGNPTLRVVRIEDGSLLDAKTLATIREMAEANDFQIWIERVGTDDPMAVVIEDGMVAS